MLSPEGRSRQVAGLVDAIDAVSLHDSDPGEQGRGELRCERVAPAFSAPVAGSAFSDQLRWDVPPKSVVRFIGYWSGDVFLGSRDVEPEERFDNGGIFVLKSLVERVS